MTGSGRPEIVILTNQRAGTVGASLATGVLQPGLGAASRKIGHQLAAFVPASGSNSLTWAFLAAPVTVTTAEYRPLPSHSALGLSGGIPAGTARRFTSPAGVGSKPHRP